MSVARRVPEPRQNHFVPTALQKRFVDSNGWLHVFRVEGSAPRVFRRRPEDLFKQRDLYTTKDRFGLAERQTERALARVESEADHVLSRIVEAARAGAVPNLTKEEEATWLLFLFLQWKRVPDLHLSVTTDAEVEAILDEVLSEARRKFPHQTEELDRLSQPAGRARMLKNARVDSLARMSPMVFDALRSRGIGIVRITQPNKRFIIGSRPVVKLTHPGKTDIRHPECELWLPIAGDVMVGLGRGAGTETLVDCIPDRVRHFNLSVVKQSTMFASASEALTHSLATAR